MLNYTEYDKIIEVCKQISIKKNADYGNESLKLFNGLSILVRMNDKIQRLNNLYNKADIKVNESIEDTLQDLINYSIYLVMLRRGKLEK